MHVYRLFKAGLLMLGLLSTDAMAGISLDSSRVIFSASNLAQGQSIGITSSPQSPSPYLIRAQVLGDVTGTQTQTLFSVTPSLFRLEPGSTNQLRIVKSGNQALVQNKESVFYLRVIALPAGQGSKPEKETELGGVITVSTGSIIKMFYRPSGLSMTQQQAMSALQFAKQGSELLLSNPGPYFVTLKSLSIAGKSVPISAHQQNTMIAPFSDMRYSNTILQGKVTWQAINDHGVTETFHGAIR